MFHVPATNHGGVTITSGVEEATDSSLQSRDGTTATSDIEETSSPNYFG
jgi:hypothetical protein